MRIALCILVTIMNNGEKQVPFFNYNLLQSMVEFTTRDSSSRGQLQQRQLLNVLPQMTSSSHCLTMPTNISLFMGENK